MVAKPPSPSTTTSTSSPGHRRYTRRPMYFPKEQSFSRKAHQEASGRPQGSRTESSELFSRLFQWRGCDCQGLETLCSDRRLGYFDFNRFEPKAPTAKVKAKEECAFCHIASAKKDEVWTQFYRLLDKYFSPSCDRISMTSKERVTASIASPLASTGRFRVDRSTRVRRDQPKRSF
jgi:hypothetical protein